MEPSRPARLRYSTGVRSLLALALPLLAAAQDFSNFEKRVAQFTLDNGLHFILVERHEAPVVSFHTYVKAGSVFDPPFHSGVARMLERMAFKGSEQLGSSDWVAEKKALDAIEEAYDRLEAERRKAPAEAPKISLYEAQLKIAIQQANAYASSNALRSALELNGAAGLRANTGADAIEYSCSLPSNRIELWFALEAQRLRHPVFREFYKERDALIEQQQTRIHANPQEKLMQAVLATAFTEHPYGAGGASRLAEIENLRVRDAERFVKTRFTPASITVAIAGDVHPAQAQQLARKYFGVISGADPSPKPAASEPPQREPRQTEVSIQGGPMLCVAYKRPGQHDKDDAVFDVISAVMNGGRTGFLRNELVERMRLAVAATTRPSIPGTSFEHLFAFFIVPAAGSTLEENEKALYEILDAFKSAPPDGRTLMRAKAALRAGVIGRMSVNPPAAELLAAAHANYGDWRKLFSILDDMDGVSGADVQRVARQYFTPERRTAGYGRAPKQPGARR